MGGVITPHYPMAKLDKKSQEKLKKLLTRFNQLKGLVYKPYPFQLEAHKATEPMVFVQAANQSGKSLGSIYEAVFHLRNIHPYKKIPQKKNKIIWLLSDTLGTCIESLFETKIKRILPEDEYVRIKEVGQFVGIRHKITGNRLMFKAYAKGMTRLQSVPVDLVVIDEQPSEWDVFMELMMRTKATGGQIYMGFTPTRVDRKLQAFIENFGKGIKIIKATAYDAAHRDKDEIEKMRAILPERDFKIRYLGEWASYEGRLIPSFKDELIVPDFKLPHDCRCVLSVDPASSGLAGFAILAETKEKDYKGNNVWYVVKEAMKSGLSPENQVRFAEEFAEEFTITDRFSDIHETWFIKTAKDMNINYSGVKKRKNEEMIVSLDNSFSEGSLKVFESCGEFIKQVYSYCNREGAQDFAPVVGDFHILDAVKYADLRKKGLEEIKKEIVEQNTLWQAIEKQFFSSKEEAKQLFPKHI